MGFQSVFKSLSGLWRSQMFGKGIPQGWGCEAEGPVAHGAEVGVGGEEKVGVGGSEASGDWFAMEQFFEVGGGVAVEALVCEE